VDLEAGLAKLLFGPDVEPWVLGELAEHAQ
jgi:hypothetical protein